MMQPTKQPYKRLLAALLCTLMLAALFVLPGCSGSDKSSSASGSGSSSSASGSGTDASASVEEEKPKNGEELLAPPGQGLYVTNYEVLAEAYCLVNEETGLAVSEKNADTPYVAASLVKMMTCILTAEYMGQNGLDWDTTMVDSTGKSWVYDALHGKNASTADIRMGEILSVRELLYAALLPSANEAALLLADFISGGDIEGFVRTMNARARELGCKNTYYVDANGLGEENVTSARDMVYICRQFMKYPELVSIAQTSVYEMAQHERHNAPYNIHSTNRLLVQSSPYYSVAPSAAGTIVAGKTGSLGDWQNFVSMAAKNGETYICAVMQSPNMADTVAPLLELETPAYRPALVETMQLYAWAFDELVVKSILDMTRPVTELRVKYSTEQDTVRLMPSGEIKAVLPKEAPESLIKRSYQLEEWVEAPVEKGEVLGSVSLTIGGQAIGSANLLAEKDVRRNSTLFLMNKMGDFLRSGYFRAAVIIVVLAVGLYAGAVALVYNSRKRRKKTGQSRTQASGGRSTGSTRRQAPPHPKNPPHNERKPK